MDYTKKGDWRLEQHGLTYQIFSGKYKVTEGIFNKKNAHLIVASPKLYKALRYLVSELERGKVLQASRIPIVRDALAMVKV